MKVEKELPGIKKNISLKNYTTFKIGGPAKHFLLAKKKEDLVKAIKTAKKLRLPFFILGGGSNLLISDKGFDGMMIKVQGSRFKVQGSTITTEAGVLLGKIISASVKVGLTGLEWAAGIPGTVGGAIYGNAGAFGKSMKNIVKEVEVFDTKKQKIKTLKNKDCKFGYKDSIFKQEKNLIILSAILRLEKGNKKKIQEKIKEYLNYRKENQPLNLPSAGSVFKNPAGFSTGELVEEDKSSSPRLAAARLIEECGLKGKIIGKAQISKKHANFIINLGGATSKDVKKLINLIKKKVKKKFKINLKEEICYLGFRK